VEPPTATVTGNFLVAAAGIGRQQYLGALEFAGGSFALAQHRGELTAFGLAQFDPITYIHPDLLVGGPDESTNESKIRRRSQPHDYFTEKQGQYLAFIYTYAQAGGSERPR